MQPEGRKISSTVQELLLCSLQSLRTCYEHSERGSKKVQVIVGPHQLLHTFKATNYQINVYMYSIFIKNVIGDAHGLS